MRATRLRFAFSLALGLLRHGLVARAALAAVMLGLLAPASLVAQNTTSAQLNGVGFFRVPSLPAMGSSVTVETWVNPRSAINWQYILSIGEGSLGAYLAIVLEPNTRKPALFLSTASPASRSSWTDWIMSSASIPLNQWSHLAATIGSDRSLRLYVNGELVASGTATANIASVARSTNAIGAFTQDGVVDGLLDGSVADVRIWSVARTQAQIQTSMAVGSITGATTGLEAAYPFRATGAAALADVSGNNRTLTSSGAVQFTSGALSSPSVTSADNLITANLTGGSYTIASLPALDGALTFEAWVRPTTHEYYSRIVDIGPSTSDNLLLVASKQSTGIPIFVVNRNGATAVWVEAPTALTLGKWTHIAGVLGTDRSARLYIDGQLVASGTSTSFGISTPSTSNFIGKSRYAQDSLFNGGMADVRIWNVARTQAQIQASMSVGSVSGATTGLVAAYPFGSTGASVLADVSGNSRGLTQTGTVGYRKLGSGAQVTTDITGTSSLNVSAGQLYLNGYNLLSGGTTIDPAATLYLLNKFSLAGTVTVASGATLRVAGHDSLGYDIDPPYVTSVTVNGGTVVMEGGPNQAASAGFILNGGRITGAVNWALYRGTAADTSPMVKTTASATPSIIDASTMQLGQAVTFDVADGAAATDLAVSTVTSGSGALVKAGAGLLLLTGNNTYSGGSTVSAGTLQVGDGGTSGSLGTGNVVNNASLVFNRSDDTSLANAISGTGSLTKSGAGTLTLNATHSYTGGTVIEGGTMRLGINGSDVGVIRGNVTVGAQGRLLLSGFNSLGWGTGTKVNAITINSGIVETTASGDQGWGVAYQLNGGELRSNGGVSSAGATSYYSMGGGTTVTTLANANPALITGRIILRDSNPNDVLPFNVADGSAAIDLLVSASITPQSTTGSLTKSGAGTMVLSGQNTYAGVTTIGAGTLQVGDGGTSGTLGTGNVVNNGILAFNRSDTTTVANSISGTGSVTKTGAGTTALSGNNTYTGNTTVSAGTLALTGSGSIANSPSITLASAAAFDASGRSSTFALGAAQTMANSGGTALLRGNMNATAGTLSMACDGSNPAFTVSGGTLTLSANTVVRVSKSGSALGLGTYKLVAKGTGGSVAGAVSLAVTVSGAGIVANADARLEVSDGELLLRVVPPATIALGNLAQTYDGNVRAASATTTPAGLAVTFTYNGSTNLPVNAGSYAVVATITAPTHFGSTNGTLVVGKAQAPISLGGLLQSYDGTARKVVAVTQPSGLTWFATYNGSANAPTNIGIYAVVATISDANYMGFTNAVLNVKAGNPGSRPAPTLQPPAYLNHHGFLADAAGLPLGSPNPRNYDLLFRIFTSPSGGASLWTERQVVVVDQGEYDVMLGEGMSHGVEPWPALDTVLATGSGTARYLEVTVRGIGVGGSDVVLRPRFLLPSQPYAFLARHARTAETVLGSNSIPVLRVSGSAVGIGVERADATLDIGGVLTATSLANDGNATVSGKYFATAFEGAGTIPLGGIVVWTGASPPQGWALCNGQTANGRRTPDLRSRFVLGHGQGSGLTARSVGQVGGQEAYVLNYNNFAPHRHVFDPPGLWIESGGGHSHSYATHSRMNTSDRGVDGSGLARGNESRTLTASRDVSHQDRNHQHQTTVSAESGPSGGGQPHNTMPPYYTLAYIMRVQ